MRMCSVLMYIALGCIVPTAAAQSLDIDQIEASVGYINDLQNTDGGFRPSESDRESDIGSTSSSLRALKYLHPRARPRNREAIPEYVLKCFDRSSGGFSSRPGGQPDVRSTAMGLMAMVELKMPVAEYSKAIASYFDKHAMNLADIYIATAALHAAGLKASETMEWIATYEQTRNADGTFGKNALDGASAVNTIVRLGGSIENLAAVAQSLRQAQSDNGGFGKPGEPADLATTYRIMRALVLLEARPDVARCREFVSKCRNDDGGYGPAPGQPSTVSTTYFAAIVLHWLDQMQ